jgi:hypothetical protein
MLRISKHSGSFFSNLLVLVDGSRIEILFRVKTFLPPLLLQIDHMLLATLRIPSLNLTNTQNSCFLLYVLAERFTFSSLSRRFNPIVAITSASAVWSNSFVTRCNCTTTIELDGFKGLGIKDCTVQKSLSII